MRRSFRRVSLFLASGAFGAWLVFTPSVVRPADLAHPVLAYYYAWWNQDVFERTLFKPFEPYNSDSNLAHMLDLGQQMGFSATIHFITTQFWGADDVIAQLRAFYENRANHPAMVRYQGRPVIFFWRASTFDNGTWDFIRGQVDPEHHAVWMADGDNFGVLSGSAWDGISPYAIAWSGDPASQLPRWANVARGIAPDKLWNPVVSPGCNDTAARAATCVQDRGDGAYYQATWDGALASSPSWAVVVSTFNEWMESTQIEPSQQWGDQYLNLTRQNADLFKASMGG